MVEDESVGPTRVRGARRRWPDRRGALLLAFLLCAGPLGGQELSQPSPWRLALDEAVALAVRNNPSYVRLEQEASAAVWGVREAYGAFLPEVRTSAGVQYVGAGAQRFGIFTGEDIGAGTTDYFLSDYSLGLRYSLSGATFYGLSSSRARSEAVEARLRAARYDLESGVSGRYLAALRATDAVDVARRGLARAEEGLELARARVDAGAAPGTDARQAEVERGRAEVILVRAENAERVERFRLLEEIGIHTDRPLELVSDFRVFAPSWEASDLVAMALDAHPTLRSARATERADRAGLRQAQSEYLPTVSVQADWSGFTRELGNRDFLLGQARGSARSQRESCQLFNQISSGLSEPLSGFPEDCGKYTLTEADERQILASNDAFPFDFQEQPLSLSFRVSLPLFQGFSRQRRVEEAEVRARASEEGRRAESLRLRTAVTTAHGNLLAAHRVVRIEERNRQVAGEQLELATERYRLGAAPFIELLDAQSSAATAEQDYLTAVYDFHAALVELERATGRELRPAPGRDTSLDDELQER